MTTTRIAVVEDNPDNRLLLHAMLDDLYQLEDYENGSEGPGGPGQPSPPTWCCSTFRCPAWTASRCCAGCATRRPRPGCRSSP